ncbi:MAG: alpha/beta hydrolase [Candidatus Riflebacteria bacterium]|nr:alpha/beta hydrolase [Candidatus Riflebacteria bacterium]
MMSFNRALLSLMVVLFIGAAFLSASTQEREDQFIKANGLQIHYVESGKGAPLILLHGGGLSLKSWSTFAPEAARHFRTIAIDSRGHGQTDNPTGKFNYDLMVEDVVAFIKVMRLEKPILCGFSDGGIIALTLAKKYPQIPSALIIGAAAPVNEDHSHYFSGLKYFFLTDSRGTLTDADLNRIVAESPEMVDRYRNLHNRSGDPEYWRTLLKNVWPMWTSPLAYKKEDLVEVKMPVLVFLGDRDQFFTVEEGTKLFRMLSNAEIAIVPGASHSFFREKSNLFNNLAQDFLLRQINHQK